MEINYKQIGMYLLIALGLFLLLAPADIFVKYTPEAVSSADKTMIMVVGGACLAGAYYLYTLEFKTPSAPTFIPPPKYDSSATTSSF